MGEKSYHAVHQAIPKKDAFSLMTGGAVYTEDFVPQDALVVLLLRSPHAFARIRSFDLSLALQVPGVVRILTYQDVPQNRFSFGGESLPGRNPADRYILDEYARFIGDPVAIIAAETAAAARKARKLIRVDYEVLQPVLNFEQAETVGIRVHPEDNIRFQCDIGQDLDRNILMSERDEHGDFDAAYAACPVQLDEIYYTAPNHQCMMETFRTYSYLDTYQRLTLISSTQITFHARRLVAEALGIPQGRVRVIKPRIGGGFGAKQTLGCEVYSAVVTYLTGRPAYCCLTQQETLTATNTRHQFRVRVRLGAEKDGTVKALWVDSLGNAGAYAEISPNVIGLSAHKTIPLYRHAKDWRYTGKAVFTNTVSAAAFRGFGAPQGCFAVECTVNKMCMQLGLDPTEVRQRNLPVVGEPMSAYYNEPLTSCSLDRCIETGKQMIGWRDKFRSAPCSRQVGPHTYRGLGMAITMQGSGISNNDQCSVTLRLDSADFYTLFIGASDMGTGCDTILAQMAAEVLMCSPDQIMVNGVDTAYSPYDKGSYASCTTYVTGNATVRAAQMLLDTMKHTAAGILNVASVDFDGVTFTAGDKSLSLRELGEQSAFGQGQWLTAHCSFSGEISPPPFVAGFAEVEVDTQTGQATLCDYVGVVDCGTVINKSLARVQAEGGLVQGIGMALIEAPTLSEKGKVLSESFMQYKIPSRLDIPTPRVAFEESHDPTGPFGAKSIGEVVINTPSPAIVSAIMNAVGAEIHTLPATAEKIFWSLQKAGKK